ncbi:Uncharacterised protein [Vibrio cholerae]|nr:Uncharacterised protein [Vibrio cholerae]
MRKRSAMKLGSYLKKLTKKLQLLSVSLTVKLKAVSLLN